MIKNINKNTDRKINRKNGFTLIELIVVVAVLAILAAVAVPMISGYTGKASSAVCLENRNMLIRMFNIHKITYPNSDFDTFFQQEFDEDTLCPNDGVYEYVDEALNCSYHGDDGSGDGEGTGGSGPSGVVELPEGHSFQASATWGDVIAKASGFTNSGYGYNQPKGYVFYDETGYYIWKDDNWLSIDSNLHDPNRTVKIDTERLIFPRDWDSEVFVTKGTVRYHDDKYFVWVNDYEGNGDFSEYNRSWVEVSWDNWREVQYDWNN